MRIPTVVKNIGIWPPYLGAGVSVTRVSPDLRDIEVTMRLRFWNRNYVGTQFGGSLYSMVDPFYMIMLIENLGREYIVWDKSATIKFIKPARGRVRARFLLTEERIAEIRHAADTQERVRPEFRVEIRDDAGEVVAEVLKVLSVKHKSKAAPAQ
jgi:hypothetical protein